MSDPQTTSDSLADRLFHAVRKLLVESSRISLELFKIMIPIGIAVKILSELGAIEPLAVVLAPVMELVGLPGEMGLVWATAMVTNIYGGLVVFASLTATTPLTEAQVTVLATMILVAHTLPVELTIARKAGARLRVMGPFRVLGAFTIGLLLHHIYTAGGWCQGAAVSLWKSSIADPSLWAWAWGEVRNLIMIFFIIVALLIVTKSLDRLGVTGLIVKLLGPLLRIMGIGRSAGSITIVGMVLGLSYGGGLIIQEAKSGRVPPSDVFFSLALMGLCHGLIEDTLLVMTMGASISGVLWGRLAFSLLAVTLLVRAVSLIPAARRERVLFRDRNCREPL